MADIDLIPHDYRRWLNQQAMMRRYFVTVVIVNLLILAAGFVLDGSTERTEELVAKLRSESALMEQQHLQLQQLKEQRTEYERQWSLLRGLRAGAAVEDIFQIVDRSLVVGRLWFVDWSFRRAGVVVDGQERDIDTGYFIIVAGKGNAQPGDGLQVETHMSIHGQAVDHQALSGFVRALFEQRFIEDVTVRKTNLTDHAGGRVVEFDMDIVLNSTSRDI